jgi:hypothetical protein
VSAGAELAFRNGFALAALSKASSPIILKATPEKAACGIVGETRFSKHVRDWVQPAACLLSGAAINPRNPRAGSLRAF